MLTAPGKPSLLLLLVAWLVGCAGSAACGSPPSDDRRGEPIFNGRDLSGWKGLVRDPIARSKMSPETLAAEQRKADELVRAHWRVENGEIINDGHGPHLCTERHYRDFELWLDWKISPGADSGIYLRGSPQVQIWDTIHGIEPAKVGSGGLYNNQKHRSTPLVKADRPAGEWNAFHIRMIGERVTVTLNGQLVVDDVPMENYWDRSRPIFVSEQIELQTHGGEIRFRDIRLREIGADEANEYLRTRDADGFTPLFNGADLTGWIGSTSGYFVQDGVLICDPATGGTLLTSDEYADFTLRFEFRLPPGGNNGLALRAPATGNPAYEGMEIQILDDTHEKYANLQPWQYHGSVYGLVPAHRGYLRPVGEWNFEEVTLKGSRLTVVLNGTVIVEHDLAAITEPMDGQPHPGLSRRSGHLGFMGHGDRVEFRNILIRPIAPDAADEVKGDDADADGAP